MPTASSAAREKEVETTASPPPGLPNLNEGPYPFEEAQRLIDRAAWINTFAMPAPARAVTKIPLPGRARTIAGCELEGVLHRFDVEISTPAPDTGIRGKDIVGQASGTLEMSLLPIVDNFVARPDRTPPPMPLEPQRSQRFALQRADFRFADGADGLTSFGTGRTFPSTAGGRSRLTIAAIGVILAGRGKLRGLGGIYVLSGELDLERGFQGDVMIRIVDPDGVLTATEPLPPLAPQSGPEAGATYLMMRSQKSGPEQLTTYDLAPNGSVRGLDVPQMLYRAHAGFSAAGSAGLRAAFSQGPVIGEELAVVSVNPAAPDTNPGTNFAPSRFQGVGEYVLRDTNGTAVGGFTAQFLEGRTVNMELEGAPGQIASRFGFFGPILESYGAMNGARGLLLGSTGVGISPHVLSNLYILRLEDPDGRFRA